MIRPSRAPEPDAASRHYDELDPFYRSLWGEHLHHGLWTTGRESPEVAARALVDALVQRAGIRPGDRVCDVGSGYGAVARQLAGRGLRVTGLTISPVQHRHALEQAHPGGDPVPRLLLRDWLENGLGDASFDAVLAIESLSHMPDPARALAEAYRVLRPGGRLVAAVWLAAESPRSWEVRHLLRPICDEGRLSGLPAPSDYGRWVASAGFVSPSLEDLSARVARTWSISAGRLVGAMLRPSSWRYLLDRRHRERRFALSVLRLLVAYRTGAMRYGVLRAEKPV